jgi:NAD(P)-dependent dehydrogenase (short-subunit alcohol dehydrogenase family)
MRRALEGKVAVVTGGGRGLGAATAAALAADGAVVVSGQRDAQAFPDHAPAGQVTPAPLDVRSEESVDALFTWVASAAGGLDLLVANAGVGVWKPLVDLAIDEWRAVLGTNLTGAFLCVRAAFRLMIPRGGGRMILVGSVADRVALPANGAYGASKYGLRGLSGVINEEGKPARVSSTLLSLGATRTGIWGERPAFDLEDMLDPAEVAQVVADLCARPLELRIDEVQVMPRKGVL